MTLCNGAALRRWLVEIGDPGLVPWFAVFLYALVVIFSLKAARRRSRGGRRLFWATLAACALFLGLNKQLDLQTLILRCGRVAATSAGWAAYRRLLEAVAGIAIAVAAAVIVIRLAARFRRLDSAIRIALTGVVLIILFIVSRSSGILHLPMLSGLTSPPLRPWIEIAGASLILLGAWRGSRRERPSPPRGPANRR